MVILAIDPGNAQSGWCVIDGETMKPQDFGKTDNNELLDSFERLIRVYQVDVAVIEMVACYGMPVGTCVWIGRFTEKSKQLQKDVQYITRKDEKMNICNSMKANDTTVRRALIDRFAKHDLKNGKGTKNNPDWFYGFKADIWAAYAVGVTWIDTKIE